MSHIILGILMLKRLTVYEIRAVIKENFKAMCSDSLGSIQAAIKKLLAEEKITYREYVEKNVNKKQYAITDKGRKDLLSWLSTPAAIANPKNMELGKLLFMGLVPTADRPVLIAEAIALLEEELAELLAVKTSAEAENGGREEIIAYWQGDAEYARGIQNATQAADIAESAAGVGDFQMVTLQYGIDSTQFQIDWFRNLEKKLKAEGQQR